MAEEQVHQNSEARDRVITAAFGLFAQRGFADVSMQQIADEASITKATLYHHFRDKQDLFLSVMRRSFSQNHEQLVKSFEKNQDLMSTIQEMLILVCSGQRSDTQRMMSDFHQHVDADTQQRFWAEFPKPWHQLEPVVERAIARGEIIDKDAAFVSKFIYGAVAGYGHIVRISPDKNRIDDDTVAYFTEAILHGISRK